MNHVGLGALLSMLVFVVSCSGTSGGEATQSENSVNAAPSSPSESPKASPSVPEVVLYQDVVSGPITSADICASYSELVDRYTSVVAKRSKSLVEKDGDPYKAAGFVEKNAWIYEDLLSTFEEDWTAVAIDALNAVSNGEAGTVDDLQAYLEASLEACGLEPVQQSLSSDVATVSRQQESVVAIAESKPWYPKGYFEIKDGFAGKWIDGGSDPCGYGPVCWYWTLDVVSESGCPQSVYVEVNFTTDGSVRDWSNDSLPSLSPLQKGRLQFYTYDRGVDSIELAGANCY